MKKLYSYLFISLLTLTTINLAQEKKPDLMPKFSGDARTWLDEDLTKHQGNFMVKNVRLQVSGSATELVSYKFLFDLAALARTSTKNDTLGGKRFLTDAYTDLGILNDAYIAIKPVSGFSISLGQIKVPFSSDNLISVNSIPFSNRPLLTSKVGPDMYDIGFMASYSLPVSLPIDIDAAIFDGNGQNKSETDKTNNYAFRTVIKPVEGLNVSGNYAGGVMAGNKVHMFDLGAGYKNGGLTLSCEYAKRNTKLASYDYSSNTYFGYAVYDFPVSSELVKFISPAVRYEFLEPASHKAGDEFSRITAGLTFSFSKLTFAHCRLNYEKFIYKNEYKAADKNSDRLVLEFQIRY
ncbi:MAG TPA: porin [Ignavibacteriales bacterium]|nr:porin [Ignavibacteriales bacterium]